MDQALQWSQVGSSISSELIPRTGVTGGWRSTWPKPEPAFPSVLALLVGLTRQLHTTVSLRILLRCTGQPFNKGCYAIAQNSLGDTLGFICAWKLAWGHSFHHRLIFPGKAFQMPSARLTWEL